MACFPPATPEAHKSNSIGRLWRGPNRNTADGVPADGRWQLPLHKRNRTMPGDSDGKGSGLIGLAGVGRESADAHASAWGQLAGASHSHEWPFNPAGWRELAACELCGLTMLKLMVNSSMWVVRRVEHVAFIDECTIRRRVSIDYVAPQGAVMLRRPDGQDVRVLPLAIMRRKSLVKFDFRDHDGRAIPLLGLRENQALTLAIARAWAAANLQALGVSEKISAETEHFLDDVIAGDQIELWRAFKRMWAADKGSDLKRLGKEKQFRALLDRLADGFVLYGLHEGPPGGRHLIKFSYDEPLTLRHSKSSYQPHHDGEGGKEEYEGTDLPRWHWRDLCRAMGFSPTRIKFP